MAADAPKEFTVRFIIGTNVLNQMQMPQVPQMGDMVRVGDLDWTVHALVWTPDTASETDVLLYLSRLDVDL